MNIQEMTNDELIKYYNSERRLYTINHNKQMAYKILLNSQYGVLSSASYRYFGLDHAKSITGKGRTAIQFVTNKTVEWLRSVFKTDYDFNITNDTDSAYFRLEPLFKAKNLDPLNPDHYQQAKELLQKFVDGPMAKKIEELCVEYAEWLNVPVNKLIMEREVISTLGGVFVAKKRYAIAVDDLEGVIYPRDNLYYKIMGMDAVKSGSTTKTVRDTLKHITKIVIEGKEEQVWRAVAEFREYFMKAEIETISTMVSVNEIDKWIEGNTLRKGTPMQVKSAYAHNKYVKANNIDVPEIEEGEKIYMVNLRKGNPVGSEIFGFIEWSDQFKHLEPFIDRIHLYEKNFVQKVQPILDAVNWSHEARNTLF